MPDGGVIPLRTRGTLEPVLAAKVTGTLVLDRVLKERGIVPDFMVLCSSVSSIIGLFGQVGYCAANAFLDAFAHYKTHNDGVHTVSIGWDFWKEVGMGVDTLRQLIENRNITDADTLLQFGIMPSEGVQVFDRVLNCGHAQVIVSTWDLFSRIKMFQGAGDDSANGPGREVGVEPATVTRHPRPHMAVEYVAPETQFQETFARILQDYFGFEKVGIHDNLFEFGITSLDMIHINNALNKEMESDIPIVVMFEYPTIYGLGCYLEQEDGEQEAPAEDLNQVEDLLHQTIGVFNQDLENN